eukprot:2533672-Prymnesium_polylepis.1
MSEQRTTLASAPWKPPRPLQSPRGSWLHLVTPVTTPAKGYLTSTVDPLMMSGVPGSLEFPDYAPR